MTNFSIADHIKTACAGAIAVRNDCIAMELERRGINPWSELNRVRASVYHMGGCENEVADFYVDGKYAFSVQTKIVCADDGGVTISVNAFDNTARRVPTGVDAQD